MTTEEAAEELKSLEYHCRPFDNSIEEANKSNRKRKALYMAIQLLDLVSYLEHARKIANLPTDGMTNEEILKTIWPDIDIVKFEDDPDIIFADCWLHNGTFLMHVDKNWLKEEYMVQKED